MKTNLLALAILFGGFLSAQTTADFENFNLGVDSFLNGSDLQGGFAAGNLYLTNTYDTQFGSWFGNAISTMTDITTPGFTNEFSSITGTGNNSMGYGVAYMSYLTNNSVAHFTGAAAGGAAEGFYINNTTYAYLSMRDGDAVGKKFGGPTGNDPDFFLLTIQKYLGDSLYNDKVEFYLADFRFADNTQDFILNEWTYVDLSSLGNADSLSFSLSSTDVGQFGMNTPAYFCYDDFTTKDEVVIGIKEIETYGFSAFPNPAKDLLTVRNPKNLNANVFMFNQLGQIVFKGKINNGEQNISLSGLPEGIYQMHLQLEGGAALKKTILKH